MEHAGGKVDKDFMLPFLLYKGSADDFVSYKEIQEQGCSWPRSNLNWWYGYGLFES